MSYPPPSAPPGQQGYPPAQPGYAPQQPGYPYPPQQPGYPYPPCPQPDNPPPYYSIPPQQQAGYPPAVPPQAGYPQVYAANPPYSTPQQGGYPTPGYPAQAGYPTSQAPPPQTGYPYGQPPQPQGYGAPQLSSQMAGMNLQKGPARAGDTPIQSMFGEGNVVILQSCASGKTLRINQAGNVEGIGGQGRFAQFRVHVRRPGIVALQNVHTPDNWLAIFQGSTIGTGKGGPYCEFLINEVEGRFACLESATCPGQFVGILPNGTVKPPANTKTGLHGRFTVSAHSTQSYPTPSSLKSMFGEGNIVILQSCASGKTLRINQAGNVEGIGGQGLFAQFRVHVRRPGIVALQNVHTPDNWLAIFQGNTIGTGKGGPYCEFLINEVEGRFACLESATCPGQYVGILPNGTVKPPANTKTGLHGRFTVSVHSSQSYSPPSALQTLFSEGNIVILRSCSSGKNLRIFSSGVVEGIGGQGYFAQFRVHVRRPGVVALQNVHTPEHWLAINQGKTVGTGQGGPFCELKLTEIDNGQYVCLESVRFPGQFVGILPNGTVKPPANTKTGLHGRFTVSLHYNAKATPSYTLSSTLQSVFSHMNIVILQSCASGKSVRINMTGQVEGVGGNGYHAQFRVHVRRPGVVALQNVHNSQNWIAIHQGRTIGTGQGGPYCELKLTEIEGRCTCLESISYPGQFVGILPDGTVKSPGDTKTGLHGRFIVSVHNE